MAALILPSRRVAQPQGPVEVDWGHPLARGFSHAAFGEYSTDIGAVVRGVSPRLAASGAGNLFGYFEAGVVPWVEVAKTRNGPAFSVCFDVIHTGSNTRQALVSQGGSGAGNGWYVSLVNRRIAFTLGAVANYAESPTVLDSNRLYRVMLTMTGNGGTVSTYIDGRLDSSIAVGNMNQPASRPTTLLASHSGTGYNNAALLGTAAGNVLLWNRALSAAEARAISQNPWQLFRPIQRRIWVPVGGAPAGVTGSLNATESGSDTALIAGQIIVRGALAATEAGADTAAASGQVLIQGALAVTEVGSDTAAISGSSVIVTTGTLAATETGSDTAAIAGNVLVQGTAAATETGADIAALSGGVLVSGALAATETGSDTAVIVGGLPTLVRAASTTSAGAWTATGAATLHQSINEPTPSDTEFISTTSASTCALLLTEAAFPGTASQALSYRASSSMGSFLTVTLRQGATQIMTRTHSLASVDTLYTQTLTAPEIATIVAGPVTVELTAA